MGTKRRGDKTNRYDLAALLVAYATLLLLPSLSIADVYRYVDERGTIHFTNVPDHRKYKLWIREKRVLLKSDLVNEKYNVLIAEAAVRYQVDHALIKAVIKTESNFNTRAVSTKGAQGLMQLMPQTALSYQVRDSFEPEANIEGGVRYLRYLINIYGGHLPLALAAYNAGEGAVAKYQGIPPFAETRNYVRRVLDHYDHYKKESRTRDLTSVGGTQALVSTDASLAQNPDGIAR